MLATEFGGMNDVYAMLYEETGDERHRAMAERFTRCVILDSLASGTDALTGLHANTQIPQVVSFARLARLTGDERLSAAARFFWETVVERRTVSICGNSVREHFHAASDFTRMTEDREGPETCNTYNMIKLSTERFEATDDPRYLDYVERSVYNHLLSSQHLEHGGLVYFTSMRPGHYRVYSQPDECFWYCVGTGIESHVKYGATLYAHHDHTLSVLQFAPSALDWAERGVRLSEETAFPRAGQVGLVFGLDAPVDLMLRIRVPTWLTSEPIVSEPFENDGRFLVIHREFHDGDRVDLTLPMGIAIDRLPDGSDWAALRLGLLALRRLLPARSGRRRRPEARTVNSSPSRITASREPDSIAECEGAPTGARRPGRSRRPCSTGTDSETCCVSPTSTQIAAARSPCGSTTRRSRRCGPTPARPRSTQWSTGITSHSDRRGSSIPGPEGGGVPSAERASTATRKSRAGRNQ